MSIEMNSENAICYKCGTKFGRRKGYFPVNYAILYKGVGYLHICKGCIDSMYNSYLSQCNDAKDAVRQMCRKLDLYWSDRVYDMVAKKTTTRSMMTQYIAKINTSSYIGKSYDDTLSDEGTLWNFKTSNDDEDFNTETKEKKEQPEHISENEDDDYEVPDDVMEFWGSGYSPSMYKELEQRRQYWMSRFPEDMELDIGTEALIRQICSLEIDINRDRIAGRAVDKSVNALNTLLGSANLKPTQKKENTDTSMEKNPLGVWTQIWETKRPVPEADPELKDVDGIIRYILIWFLGHLCKMLGIKNTYSKLYEEEIARIRVDKPEYEDDDDETMLYKLFGNDEDTGEEYE